MQDITNKVILNRHVVEVKKLDRKKTAKLENLNKNHV